MEIKKICTKCNIEKDISGFQIRTDTGKYRHQCVECRLEYSKSHYNKNKEKRLEQCRDYYNTHKEQKRRWGIKYRAETKEYQILKSRRYYNNNKDKVAIRVKQYRSTSHGQSVIKNHASKRRIKIQSGNITNSQIKSLIEKTNNCYWCNTKIKRDFHLDHYIPLSKGGTHTIDNIVVSCPTCNLRKNAKDPYEFANQIGRLL